MHLSAMNGDKGRTGGILPSEVLDLGSCLLCLCLWKQAIANVLEYIQETATVFWTGISKARKEVGEKGVLAWVKPNLYEFPPRT